MTRIRSYFVTTLVVVTAACSAAGATSPADDALLARGSGSTGTTGAAGASGAQVLVKCDARTGRSDISVDGKNLAPLNGQWSARVSSGANTATAPLTRAVGDEVEFDFSSQPNDIAAGAVAIPRTFIAVSATAPDVTASILDAAGAVVATGSADCRTR